MEERRICKICGNEFTAHNPNQRYCSLVCGSVARRLKTRRWTATHPGYSTKYVNKYRERMKEQKED